MVTNRISVVVPVYNVASYTLKRLYEDLTGSAIMQQRLLDRVPERAGDIATLKRWYDLGCYISYIKSGGHKGQPRRGRGSLLYHVDCHTKAFNARMSSEEVNP